MKKRKWIRLLCSIITAGSMLMGTALAAEPVTPGNPNAVLVDVPGGTEVKREWIPADVDSLRGTGGWEDNVYYIPSGSTVNLSINPDFDGKILSLTLIDCTLLQDVMENNQSWWDSGCTLDFYRQDGQQGLPITKLTCGSLTDSAGKSMQFGQSDHLYALKVSAEWELSAADYYHVAYFRIADSQPGSVATTAIPTSSKVVVDGETIAFDAYLIGGNNYFKLRDIAQVLSGSDKQFEVTWDGAKNAINLISGQPYTPVGGELAAGSGANQTATPTSSTIYLDGEQINLTAYTIQGNNYFKLRDLGQTFDFGVGWDGANNTVTIDTSTGYTPE